MIMEKKIKIGLIGLAVCIILVGSSWYVLNIKQTQTNEFCTEETLEDCNGQKVSVTGYLYWNKGYVSIDLENRTSRFPISITVKSNGVQQDRIDFMGKVNNQKVNIIGKIISGELYECTGFQELGDPETGKCIKSTIIEMERFKIMR